MASSLGFVGVVGFVGLVGFAEFMGLVGGAGEEGGCDRRDARIEASGVFRVVEGL